MAVIFAMKATMLMLLVSAGTCATQSGVVDTEYDEVSLLQSQLKVKQIEAEAKHKATVSSGSMCEIPEGMVLAGNECISATKADEALFVGRIGGDEKTTKRSPLTEEKEPTLGSAEPSAESVLTLRCILNSVILAVIVDALRRGFRSKVVSEKEEVAAVKAPAPLTGADRVAKTASLLQSAQQGDVAACDLLLNQGLHLREEDDWGCTALHAAAKGGSKAVIAHLLKRGAQVDALDAWDETPLHYAARAGSVEVIGLLLAGGAKIDAVNAQDWTPLVGAGSAGQQAVCKLLLAHGATQGDMAEANLPAMLQALLRKPEESKDDILKPKVEDESDLLRRVLQPKPEWDAEQEMAEYQMLNRQASEEDW